MAQDRCLQVLSEHMKSSKCNKLRTDKLCRTAHILKEFRLSFKKNFCNQFIMKNDGGSDEIHSTVLYVEQYMRCDQHIYKPFFFSLY
jgi:hypothetical protein